MDGIDASAIMRSGGHVALHFEDMAAFDAFRVAVRSGATDQRFYRGQDGVAIYFKPCDVEVISGG